MNKNVKRIFFVTMLLVLLLGVGTLSASDISNGTTTDDNNDNLAVSDLQSDTTVKSVDTTTSKNIKKEAKTYIVNNDTVKNVFSNTGKSEYALNNFDTNTLNNSINEGDILDFQGTITGNYNLTINKPVNIISSTNDALINLNTTCLNLMGTDPGNSFSIISGGSYSNITNITFYNTQLFVINASHVTIDHINATVIGNPVGGGVGQTSIRENSSYITVKNSYFYTENNGGSSTLVLAWANHCDIINNTVNAGEGAGNLFYFTTYNVNIPENEEYNSYNKVINNTIGEKGYSYGGIQYCCSLMGKENIIEGNYMAGPVMFQAALFITQNTTFRNNIIDGAIPCGSGNIIDNNTCKSVTLTGNNIQILNNNISDSVKLKATNENITIKNNKCSIELNKHSNAVISENNIIDIIIKKNTVNVTVEKNNITGSITIDKGASKNNIHYNNITGNILINGEENVFMNNNITNENLYTMSGTGTNNIITDNYLKAETLYGDESANLNKETNTIANNTPKIEVKIDTTIFTVKENATITASIYFNGEIVTDINKGKVSFKVNGKTLKDANGKVIYAKIVNGTASIEDFTVPDTWKDGMKIKVTYTGNKEIGTLKAEENITITAPEATLTITPIDTTTAGSTITLQATINDNNKEINTGKIVFKINCKTVKDANGKVIYAKVVNNTVSVDYTIPESMKTGNYTITAVYVGSGYDKLESETSLTVAN